MRFCTNCQRQRPLEGGQFTKFKTTKRWKCAICLQKLPVSVYASKKNAKV